MSASGPSVPLVNLSGLSGFTCAELCTFSSPEQKALGELIGWDWSQRPSVLPSVYTFNMNISETSCPIKIKYHLEHQWGGGLTALRFRQDRIRTLVSMATDSSHRVIMGKIL